MMAFFLAAALVAATPTSGGSLDGKCISNSTAGRIRGLVANRDIPSLLHLREQLIGESSKGCQRFVELSLTLALAVVDPSRFRHTFVDSFPSGGKEILDYRSVNEVLGNGLQGYEVLSKFALDGDSAAIRKVLTGYQWTDGASAERYEDTIERLSNEQPRSLLEVVVTDTGRFAKILSCQMLPDFDIEITKFVQVNARSKSESDAIRTTKRDFEDCHPGHKVAPQ